MVAIAMIAPLAAGPSHAHAASVTGVRHFVTEKIDITGGSAGQAAPMSASGSAVGPADSTVESNKVKRFAEIPKESLVSIKELHDMIEKGALKKGELKIVDIRSHRDYQKVQIEGSRNIPAGRQIEIRIDEIPDDVPVVLIAYKNSDRLAENWFTLMDHGYDPDLVKVADGGVSAWAEAGYPTLKNQFLGC